MMINGSLNENSKEKNQHLFNIFPVGMLIFAKTTDNNKTEFALKYINETAFKIFRKSNPRSEEEIKERFKKFKKLEKFSTLSEVYSNMNDLTEENLYNRIFDDFDQSESEICERYISREIMIYVKIKIHQEYKLVTMKTSMTKE